MPALRFVPDPVFGPANCPACGAPIVWALTESDWRVPLDLTPVSGGLFEIFTEHFPGGDPVEPGIQRARVRPADRPASSPAWNLHTFETCSARRGAGARRLPPRGNRP